MKNDLGLGFEAPIYYNRLYKGYEYTEKGYSINNQALSQAEKEQIKSATEMLMLFKDSKFGNNISTQLQRLNIILDNPEFENETKIIEFENSNFKSYELLQELYKFIKNKNEISIILYENISKKMMALTILPLMLKEYRNNWYLIFEDKYGTFVSANLYQIYDPVLIESNRKQISDFEPNNVSKYFVGAERINEDVEIEDVEIKFNAEVAQEIKNNPLHPSQKIIKEKPNGDIVVSYNLCVTQSFATEILKFGNKALVTKNENLQDLIIDGTKTYLKYFKMLS